jgi:hypothetical protein
MLANYCIFKQLNGALIAMRRRPAAVLLKGLARNQRFDANKGLRIEAVRVTTDKAEVKVSAAIAGSSTFPTR